MISDDKYTTTLCHKILNYMIKAMNVTNDCQTETKLDKHLNIRHNSS